MKRSSDDPIDIEDMRQTIKRGRLALRPACMPESSIVRNIVTNVNDVFDALECKIFISKAGRDERVAAARALEPELPNAVTDVYYDHKTGSVVISAEKCALYHEDNADVIKRCNAKVESAAQQPNSIFRAPDSVVDEECRCYLSIK